MANVKAVVLIVNHAKMEIHVLNVNQLTLLQIQDFVGSVEQYVGLVLLVEIVLMNSIRLLEMDALQGNFWTHMEIAMTVDMGVTDALML